MSGLLHRLAARTLTGTAPRLRSVAPIPWLATPDAVHTAPPTPPDSAVAQAYSVAPGAPAPETPEAPPPGRPVGSPPTGTMPTTAEPEPSCAALTPAPRSDMPKADVPQPNPQPIPVLPVDPRPAPGRRAVPPPVAAPGRHPRPETPLPAPLLPPADAPAAPGRVATTARAAAADREPATEVYVHIGRVELTAVTESPAPQRKPQPVRTGRSLDEFLQQRKDRHR